MKVDVYTESGTCYRIDYFAGTVTRRGGAPMRRDGERLRIHWLGRVAVGLPLHFVLERLGHGVSTDRLTTPVVRIVDVP